MKEAYKQRVEENLILQYYSEEFQKWIKLDFVTSNLSELQDEKIKIEKDGRKVRILKYYVIEVWEIIDETP